MSDSNLVACEQDHEMKYILQKYDKRQTADNIKKLRKHCKVFKSKVSLKPHNRENFYKYMKDKKVLKELE